MSTKTSAFLLVGCLLALPALAEDGASVADQVAALDQTCADSAEARQARHGAAPLYGRLGGYDEIHQLTREIVRLHQINDAISHHFDGVDGDDLAKQVADFMSAGTGGAATYGGRDMHTSHLHLGLTDADFLAAGGDVIQAMKNLGHGQEEIDEVVCILVSLKDQVVLEGAQHR